MKTKSNLQIIRWNSEKGIWQEIGDSHHDNIIVVAAIESYMATFGEPRKHYLVMTRQDINNIGLPTGLTA